MYEDEKIYKDKTAWVSYECEEAGDTIYVYQRCPECGKYIKRGEVLTNLDGDARLKGWKCKTHGEIVPFWVRE